MHVPVHQAVNFETHWKPPRNQARGITRAAFLMVLQHVCSSRIKFRIKWKWSNKIVQSSQHSHFILVAFYLLDSFVILLSSAGRSPVELIRKFASCVLKILYVPNIVLPAQHFLMHFRYWKIIYLKCIPEIFMEEEQYYLNIFLQILDRIKIAILLHEKWRIKACS